MRLISIALSMLALYAQAQTVEHLELPVVAIYDNCHQAFDQEEVSVVSKENILSINKIWTTYNTCYNYSEDTAYASSFRILFCDIFGEQKSRFLISDGSIHGDSYSYIQHNLEKLKPHDRIIIEDIQFDRDGALHQVPRLVYIVDSAVVPQLDTCWTLFPMVWKPSEFSSILTTKEHLKKILKDSFGYSICQNELMWPADTSLKITWMLMPRNTLQISTFSINRNSNLSELFCSIDSLNYGDQVFCRKTLYMKNKVHHYVPEYRFEIIDKPVCPYTINMEEPNVEELSTLFERIRTNETDTFPCLVNAQGALVRFKLILTTPSKSLITFTSYNGTLTNDMIAQIRQMPANTNLIFDKITIHDSVYLKTRYYTPVIIKLP